MKNNPFDLSGKIAVVSGASRGIGESSAKLLASYGAHVVLTSRKIDSLKKVEEEIRKEGYQATAMACHTGKIEEIKAFFQQVKEKFGKLDILVNNAATNPFYGSVLEVDLESWEKTMDVNLKGYFFMSQNGAKLMVESGGGAIVNVASINAVSPAPGQSTYSISKAGVMAMTKSYAIELARFNVRVNTLLPGLTDTKFASAMTQDENFMKVILPQIPLRRMAQPDEMAGTVLYLVSDASSYTTGTHVTVDGGLTT